MSSPDSTLSASRGRDEEPSPGDLLRKALQVDQDSVETICKDVVQRTDKLVQAKVDELLSSAAGQLQTSFDRQQAQLNASLEEELRCCHEKVAILEAEKEQMRQTVQSLQEQLNSLTTALYANQLLSWPGPGQFADPSFPFPHPAQIPEGSLVNVGMMGPFATYPSGLPLFPAFPAVLEPAAPEVSEASQGSTTAPSSPPAITPSTSAPPTPSRAPIGPPAVAPPSPPPGLESELPSAAVHSAMPAPLLQAPPGLTGSPRAKPSAPISISAALEQKAKPELGEKAQLTPEDLHGEALKRMMRADAADTASSARLQSPSGLARNPLSPMQTLNLTPKQRTPRLSHGKITPGMKSPAIPASPFVICESGGSVFGFTLRKADDCSLGLDVDHTDVGNYLKVTGVKAGGAMQAWNKQCVGGRAAEKAIVAGDKIVKVNNATTATEMLRECREQKLLRFTVQRGEVDDDFDPLSLSGWGASS